MEKFVKNMALALVLCGMSTSSIVAMKNPESASNTKKASGQVIPDNKAKSKNDGNNFTDYNFDFDLSIFDGLTADDFGDDEWIKDLHYMPLSGEWESLAAGLGSLSDNDFSKVVKETKKQIPQNPPKGSVLSEISEATGKTSEEALLDLYDMLREVGQSTK